MFYVMKDNLPEDSWESIFRIKLGSLSCNTMINVVAIGSDMLNFNLGFYQGRRDFDNKKFAIVVLDIKYHF